MSAADEIPCLCCGALPERAGDFNDYLQCSNPECKQRAFAIHETAWPSEMTEAEKRRAAQEAEE